MGLKNEEIIYGIGNLTNSNILLPNQSPHNGPSIVEIVFALNVT
jgi:hypothetical protein